MRSFEKSPPKDMASRIDIDVCMYIVYVDLSVTATAYVQSGSRN